MRDVLIGQADLSVLVKIVGADGAPVTGLVHTDIDLAYARVETDNDVTTSDVTPASLASLTAAHADWGFIEVSAGDHPGLYRLDIADAVFASGAWEAVVTVTDASGTDFYAVDVGFRLVAFNAQDGTRLGLTALPNAAADAAGGLPISDAGGLDLDGRLDAAVSSRASQTSVDTIDDYIDTEVAAIKAKTDNLPTDPADASDVAAGFAALNDLSAADVRSAVGLASANLDTQLDALPTAAENRDALLGASLPAVTGVASTVGQAIHALWRRFFAKVTATSTQVKTYADNGTDVLTTQTVSDDGSVETQGPAV